MTSQNQNQNQENCPYSSQELKDALSTDGFEHPIKDALLMISKGNLDIACELLLMLSKENTFNAEEDLEAWLENRGITHKQE